MKLGTNTFGLGAAFNRNINGTITSLKDAGITSVEPCVVFPGGLIEKISFFIIRKLPVIGGIFPPDSAEEIIRKIRGQGLTVSSIHVMGINWKRGNVDTVIRFCKDNSIKYAVVSFMEESVSNVRSMLPGISAASKALRNEGILLLVHNHAAEWKENEGTNVMDFLAENVPDIGFELDAGWTEFAGVSSVDAMKKLGDRILLLHLKEIMKDASDLTKPFCVAPGTGILPLGDVLKAAADLPLDEDGIIIDQDNSVNGDILADIREGVQNILAAAPSP